MNIIWSNHIHTLCVEYLNENRKEQLEEKRKEWERIKEKYCIKVNQPNRRL
jgi:hypothetical protein